MREQQQQHTSTTAALTKSQFLKQGNAICNKGNQQINKVAHQTFTKKKYPNGPPPKSVQTKFVTDTVIPSVQSQIDGIKALGAPTGDEAQVKAIVDASRPSTKAKADRTNAQNNSKNDPFAEANQLGQVRTG